MLIQTQNNGANHYDHININICCLFLISSYFHLKYDKNSHHNSMMFYNFMGFRMIFRHFLLSWQIFYGMVIKWICKIRNRVAENGLQFPFASVLIIGFNTQFYLINIFEYSTIFFNIPMSILICKQTNWKFYKIWMRLPITDNFPKINFLLRILYCIEQCNELNKLIVPQVVPR